MKTSLELKKLDYWREDILDREEIVIKDDEDDEDEEEEEEEEKKIVEIEVF